ncbi:MAG: TatD family hydrolase [Candidatus Asgardarchaeia archaeon]
MKLIDAHCHIDAEEFDNDREYVIKRAKEVGIIKIINSSLGPKYIQKGLIIKRKYPEIIELTFGLMPYDLDEKLFQKTIELIEKHKSIIIGIGEVGLDYYWIRDHKEREKMVERFRAFIHLSQKLKLPLVIHSRSAGKYAIQVLIEENAKNVLMHSFDGSRAWVRRGIEQGYYFSVPTSVMYSIQKQKMVEVLPLENMLLESDAPVLSPVKGERNEPANIAKFSLKKIAEIKKVDEDIVAKITTENATKLFNLTT